MKTHSKSLRTLVCCLGWLVLLGTGDISVGAEPKALGVTVEWDPNPEPNIAGYRIYLGRHAGNYDSVIDVGLQTSGRVPTLEAGIKFYFAVTAYLADGLESPFSDEVSYTVPIDGTNALVIPMSLAITNRQSPAAVRFTAQLGRSYFVQASSDLRTWETLRTFPATTIGVVNWNDVAPSGRPQRFYRVVSQLGELPPGNVGAGLPNPDAILP